MVNGYYDATRYLHDNISESHLSSHDFQVGANPIIRTGSVNYKQNSPIGQPFKSSVRFMSTFKLHSFQMRLLFVKQSQTLNTGLSLRLLIYGTSFLHRRSWQGMYARTNFNYLHIQRICYLQTYICGVLINLIANDVMISIALLPKL